MRDPFDREEILNRMDRERRRALRRQAYETLGEIIPLALGVAFLAGVLFAIIFMR